MSDTRTVHDPFLGKDVLVGDKLTDRLRGKYAIGPMMPNGEPEFGWQQFDTPPIQHAAAAEIERLRIQVEGKKRPAQFLAWAREMFGSVALLRSERLLRFVEEAIELAHAEDMPRETLDIMARRVYSRPRGDTPKEIGQAQACLETFAENIGLSSADEAQREWERVQTIPRTEWEHRHAAKQAIGIALPSDNSK